MVTAAIDKFKIQWQKSQKRKTSNCEGLYISTIASKRIWSDEQQLTRRM